MAELSHEWEEEKRLHQLNVRKQRAEMMRDMEAVEVEYEAKLLQFNDKTGKVRTYCIQPLS
jgi:ribosomal protein L28